MIKTYLANIAVVPSISIDHRGQFKLSRKFHNCPIGSLFLEQRLCVFRKLGNLSLQTIDIKPFN